MASMSCKECGKSVSTDAVACLHCGAPQQPPVMPSHSPQSKEETIYSDNAIVVTNARVVIGRATHALRNVISVKMLFTPPRLVKPILLLVIGLIILLAAFVELDGKTPAPFSVYILAGGMIGGAILWMCNANTMYHVGLSSASGEIHALTSKDKAYIERVVLSINDGDACSRRTRQRKRALQILGRSCKSWLPRH